MMKFQHLFMVVLVSTMVVSPVHATFRLSKWISGPCGEFPEWCDCTRKGIYAYEATCAGTTTVYDNDQDKSITVYYDLKSSGKNFGGAESNYCQYTDEAKKTEYFCTTINYESNGLIFRLFFGPGYQVGGTCTATQKGVPCECIVSDLFYYWPEPEAAFCTDNL